MESLTKESSMISWGKLYRSSIITGLAYSACNWSCFYVAEVRLFWVAGFRIDTMFFYTMKPALTLEAPQSKHLQP